MLQKRRAEILARIRQEKMVSVTLLATEYKVSEETIRRDLVFLENKKYLKIALESCEFLLENTYNGEHFSFIGCI